LTCRDGPLCFLVSQPLERDKVSPRLSTGIWSTAHGLERESRQRTINTPKRATVGIGAPNRRSSRSRSMEWATSGSSTCRNGTTPIPRGSSRRS
jgi:hypothetical protein